MMENLLNNLTSNGYVFAGTLIALVFVLGIIYGACNFTFTDYMSSWGRFLLSHNFKWVGKDFLGAFLFVLIGGAIFLLVYDFDTQESGIRASHIYAGVIAFMLLVGIVGQVLRYCRWCWGTMPLRGVALMTLVLGGLYGAYLFLTHPAIPDGAIWSAFLKAIKLGLKEEDMAWRESIVLTDFQTYVSVFHNPNRWRTILYGFGGLCIIHLVLCNAWMHCRGWIKKIVAPVLSCLIASAFVPLALVLGFGGCSLAFQALILVIYGAVGMFVIWFVLALFWGANVDSQVGGRGRLSDGTEISQRVGDEWVDKQGHVWRNTHGNEFRRVD